jgi:DNA repair protein RecN (Recombination protein N)
MLALKTVLAARDRVPTMVFDEIDAGIGGRVADMVGQKLVAIARERQVLCVTHLAPIAVRAAAHQRVVKSVRSGRTTVAVGALARTERVEEIARMLGGEAITEAARRHARELLAPGESTARGRSG